MGHIGFLLIVTWPTTWQLLTVTHNRRVCLIDVSKLLGARLRCPGAFQTLPAFVFDRTIGPLLTQHSLYAVHRQINSSFRVESKKGVIAMIRSEK